MAYVTDWATPGTVTVEPYLGSPFVWADQNNAKVSDDVYTTCATGGIGAVYTKALYASNFTFGIPNGCIIVGVEAAFEKKRTT